MPEFTDADFAAPEFTTADFQEAPEFSAADFAPARSEASPLRGLIKTGTAGVGNVLKGAATAFESAPAIGWEGMEFERPEQLERDLANIQARNARTPAQVVQEIHQNPVYQAGQAVEEFAPYAGLENLNPVAPQVSPPLSPAEQASKLTRAGEMVGGFVPAAGGPLAMAAQATGEHLDADLARAKARGVDDNTAAQEALDKATLSGGLQGTIFAAMPPMLRGALEKYVVDRFGTTAASRFLLGRAAAGTEGAALGTASTAAENAVEGQPLGHDVVTGAGAMAAMNLLLPWLRERTSTAPVAENESAEAPASPAEAPATTTQPSLASLAPEPTLVKRALDEAAAAMAAGEEGGAPPVAEPEVNVDELLAEMQRNQIAPKEAEPAPPQPAPALRPEDAAKIDELIDRAKALTAEQPGATTITAAPETKTGPTAGPETLETPTTSTAAQRGALSEPGAMATGEGLIPVEGGSNPPRSAAAPRTGVGSVTNARGWDLIDEVEGSVGKIDPALIKEANPDFKPVGAARKIFSSDGVNAADAAKTLASAGMFRGDTNQPDQLGEALNEAARSRIGNRQGAALEAKQLRQDSAFERDKDRPGPNQVTRVAEDLQVGDTLKVRGALQVDNRTYRRGREGVITDTREDGSGRTRLAQPTEEGQAPAKSALEAWADDVLEGGAAHAGPEVIAAYAVKGAYVIARIARQVALKFEDWANQMLAEHGPKVGPYLRQIWPEALRLREEQLETEAKQAIDEPTKKAVARELDEVKALRSQTPKEPKIAPPSGQPAPEKTPPGSNVSEKSAVEGTENAKTPGTAYGSPEDRARADQATQRLSEVAQRLGELNTKERREHGLTKEERSERYQLAKESRDLQRDLARNPDHVADLIRAMDQHMQEAERARPAGNGAGATASMEAARGIMEGDFPNIPQKLLSKVYNDLVARGEVMGTKSPELASGRTLEDLTRWLRAQRIDSPKLSIRDRFNLAARLADKFNQGKDAVTRAWQKVAAMWEAFKEQYKHPPTDSDFRRVIKEWFYQKQWTGLETHRWIQEINRKVPDPVRQSAISVWVDAGGDENLLRAQASEVPPRFRKIWQTATELTDDEKAIGRQVMADFERKLEDGQNLGLIDRGREDYGVPQVWSVMPKSDEPYDPLNPSKTPRRPGSKLDPRDPFFALERQVPSYFDGIMSGGVPKGLKISDLVGLYNAEFHNALADRSVIKALKDAKANDGTPIVQIAGNAHIMPRENGGRTYFVDSNWRPKDAVTKDGRLYQPVDHWALRDWKFASRTEEGNPVIVRGDFLVHPDYVGFLKNELGKSWLRDPEGGGKYFNWLLNSAAFLKANKFASATFHMATIGEHAIFHGVLPITSGVELDPAHNPKLAGLMRNGLDLGFGHQQELFSEGLASHGGIYGHVPGLGDAMTRMSDFLFKRYIPAIKAKAGQVILERNLQRYAGKLSEDQIYELSAQQANAAFGIQNWRLLGTNKRLLDMNRLLLTAPDFLLSRAKVVAQALKPYGREQRYFLLAQAALVYGAARALNELLDGDPHWEPENALSVVYNGRAYSGRFLVNDIWHLVTNPTSFAQGRLGPLPRSAIEAITQRDMRTGARIQVPFETSSATLRAAQVLLKDLAMWMVPVGVEGLLPGAKGREETGPGQVALALAGVGSRKYTPATQVYQWAKDFNRNSPDAAVRLLQQKQDNEAHGENAYRELDTLLDAGDLDKAAREYQSLVEEGNKPQSISMHYARAQSPFTGSRAREATFVASLNDAQKGIYQRALQERAQRQQAFGRMISQLATAGGVRQQAALAP